MAIVYDKLLALLDERGYTTYKIQKSKLIANSTWTKMQNSTKEKLAQNGEVAGGFDYRTMDKVCRELGVQPGDICEYVEDPPKPE